MKLPAIFTGRSWSPISLASKTPSSGCGVTRFREATKRERQGDIWTETKRIDVDDLDEFRATFSCSLLVQSFSTATKDDYFVNDARDSFARSRTTFRTSIRTTILMTMLTASLQDSEQLSGQ